jgi:hypothetical protein
MGRTDGDSHLVRQTTAEQSRADNISTECNAMWAMRCKSPHNHTTFLAVALVNCIV